jgi:hypothetical protein
MVEEGREVGHLDDSRWIGCLFLKRPPAALPAEHQQLLRQESGT